MAPTDCAVASTFFLLREIEVAAAQFRHAAAAAEAAPSCKRAVRLAVVAAVLEVERAKEASEDGEGGTGMEFSRKGGACVWLLPPATSKTAPLSTFCSGLHRLFVFLAHRGAWPNL